MDFASRRFYQSLGLRERQALVSMTHHSQIRWYNPTLEDYEWRAVPTTDEQALEVLEGSPYSATCTQTYREWRQLGATIEAALSLGRARRPRNRASTRSVRATTHARGTAWGQLPASVAIVLPGCPLYFLGHESPAAEAPYH